jgi:hypothetical protein
MIYRISNILSRLEKVKQTTSDQFVACCQAHNDKSHSLSIRTPQTIRKWHCLDCAPMDIRPIKINWRLSWKVSDIQKLLEGSTI